ncbi:DUF2065 family protein [Candidatus Gracilibacteria bacterium]|nr:DUF2065 family protein [Candidatus Gracilibacteria bacterium]
MMTLYIGGFLAALMGLLILESQNTFLVITILGYIAVIKGILILIFPQWTIQTFQKINFSENIIRIAGILCFALGSYVSFLGFM